MKCLYCGEPVRKHTTRVWVRAAPGQYDHTGPSTRYVYVGDTPPATKTDCQRLSNQMVLAVGKGHDGSIRWFSEWDGETYLPVAKFFCKNECAMNFGRAAARAGYRVRKEA